MLIGFSVLFATIVGAGDVVNTGAVVVGAGVVVNTGAVVVGVAYVVGAGVVVNMGVVVGVGVVVVGVGVVVVGVGVVVVGAGVVVNMGVVVGAGVVVASGIVVVSGIVEDASISSNGSLVILLLNGINDTMQTATINNPRIKISFVFIAIIIYSNVIFLLHLALEDSLNPKGDKDKAYNPDNEFRLSPQQHSHFQIKVMVMATVTYFPTILDQLEHQTLTLIKGQLR
jgi:hypothetical protein